jgi:hypothetical protein
MRKGIREERICRCCLIAVLLFAALAGFAQSTPTIVLTSSVNPGINGQPVTFTAVLSGGSGNPIPTGTVTFLDSGTALYSPVTLNATGSAVFTSSSLSAATHSITASYSGDGNYLPVTSTVLSEVVVPAPDSDYTLTAPVLTQTVAVGNSTSYSITITPTNGYNGTITLSCVGLQGATCAFNPSSLTPNNIETTLVSNLTVTTNMSTSALRPAIGPGDSLSYGLLASLAGGGLFAIVLLGSAYRRRGLSASTGRSAVCTLSLGILVFTMILLLGGCGGSTTGSTTPIGTQNFTVNATGTAGTNGGNTGVHQLSLTLIVTTASN